MSLLEAETMSEGSSTLPNGNGSAKLATNGSLSTLAADTKSSPSSSPDTVHLNGDLKMAKDSKAPLVQNPYNMANSMVDLPCAAYALELFLASHMLESEEYMNKSDPQKYVTSLTCILHCSCIRIRERLYFATGYGLIQCVKALMSYDDQVCLTCCFNLLTIKPTLSFSLGPASCDWPYAARQSDSSTASQKTKLLRFSLRGIRDRVG